MKWKGIGILIGLFQTLPVFGSFLDDIALGLSFGMQMKEPQPFINMKSVREYYQNNIPLNVFGSEETLPQLPAPLVSDPLEVVKGPLYPLEDHQWLLRLLRKKRSVFCSTGTEDVPR